MRFTVPASWQGQSLVLNIGRPDDGAEAFFNGKRLSAVTRFGDQLRFRLKPDDVQFGKENFIAVRVRTYDATGKRYVSVVNRAASERTLEVTIPATANIEDLVTGNAVPSRVTDGATHLRVTVPPMSLSSFSLAP